MIGSRLLRPTLGDLALNAAADSIDGAGAFGSLAADAWKSSLALAWLPQWLLAAALTELSFD